MKVRLIGPGDLQATHDLAEPLPEVVYCRLQEPFRLNAPPMRPMDEVLEYVRSGPAEYHFQARGQQARAIELLELLTERKRRDPEAPPVVAW